MAKPILIRCPTTGINVQGLIKGEPPADGSRQYEAIECLACGQFHFINIATGKLLSKENDK